MSILSWFEEHNPQLADQYKEFIVTEKLNIVGEVPVTKGVGGPKIGVAKVEKTKSGALVHHMRLDPEYAAEIFGNDIKMGSFSIKEEQD